LFGLYLRSKLEESTVFENDVATQTESDNINFLQIIRFYYKDIFVCFVDVVFFNVTKYMVTASLPTYLEKVIKLDATTSSLL
ncbi:MFS transporter, partial [Staphylococcus aureus]